MRAPELDHGSFPSWSNRDFRALLCKQARRRVADAPEAPSSRDECDPSGKIHFRPPKKGARLIHQCLQCLAKNSRMAVDVFVGSGGRHKRHVVKPRQQNATVHGEVHESLQLKIHSVVRFASVAWCSG